jgi:hypothetical protein
MINYQDVKWTTAEDKQNKLANNIAGMAIAYVVGDEVVHMDVVDSNVGTMLYSADSFTENSIDEQTGSYTVNIIKNNEVVETILCDEMLYSILLSDAKAINVDDGHEYGRIVTVGWKFLDDTFKLPGQYE